MIDKEAMNHISTENEMWARHPTTTSLLSMQRPTQSNTPAVDVGRDVLHHVLSFVAEQQQAAKDGNINNCKAPQAMPHKDIGDVHVEEPPKIPFDLESSEQQVLNGLLETIGDNAVSFFKMKCAPKWLIEKAIEGEKANYRWTGAYEEVHISEVPCGSNFSSSHKFFQVKTDRELKKLKLKFRMVPHGNKDKEMEEIRKDSTTAQFPTIRALISIAACLGLSLAAIDIKSAYLQAGNLLREIYVRPPPGWAPPRVVWKLLKPAYGIVESGRKWQRVIDKWLKENEINEVPGMPQLFTKVGKDGLELALVKVVDDFLIAGSDEGIEKFHTEVSSRFTVGRFLRENGMMYNRLSIEVEKEGSNIIDMSDYMAKIHKIEIPRHRKKQPTSKCTKEEIRDFLALTGSLNYLGHGVLPQAAFAASHLQRSVCNLTVAHLVTANNLLDEIKTLVPRITFRRPSSIENPTYLAFSDASQGKTSYGQTGYLSGLYLPSGGREYVMSLTGTAASRHASLSPQSAPRYSPQRRQQTEDRSWQTG